MKKYFLYLFVFVGFLFFLAGCLGQPSSSSKVEELAKDSITVDISNNNSFSEQKDSEETNFNKSKYQQLEPKEKEETNITQIKEIELNLTNISEYQQEEQKKEQKIIKAEVQGAIALDETLAKISSNICKIEVFPRLILKGNEATVSIYANSFNQEVYYNCAEQKKFAGKNGIFRRESICKFDKEGLLKQKVWLDEEECASVVVFVANKSLDNFYCILFDKNITEENNAFFIYSAKVFVLNFNSTDEITLSCANKTISKKISDYITLSNFGFFNITCSNILDTSEIKLKVGNYSCEFTK
ncbi:MAG: hypothetical protein N3D10_03700 [Candidatus Micrarchaeota archaeon]|nr:hypothetical protein [Candidatus Micrarchaeota archaeon]